MADHHGTARLVRAGQKRVGAFACWRYGFFEKHVVASAQKRERGFNMEGVHRAVEDGVGELGFAGDVVGAGKAPLGRQAECGSRCRPPCRVGFGDSDYLKLSLAGVGLPSVNHAPVAAADDDDPNDVVTAVFHGLFPSPAATIHRAVSVSSFVCAAEASVCRSAGSAR